MRSSPSHTAVAANGSMGLWCSTGMRYSVLIRTAACSNARAGSPRATECAGSHFEIAPRLRCASKSVTCGLRSCSTRTSEAANRAILEFLRDDQRHRLTAEQDFVVIERTEGRAGRRHLVGIFLVRRCKLGPMLVRKHVEHAVDRQRIRGMNALDPPLGNGGRDHETMRQAGHVVFGGVFRKSGNLRVSIDAGGRLAEVAGGGHGALPAHLIRLSACDCGVPRAAWVSARRMPRRASSILKSLWPKPRASRSTVSAACRKFSRVARAPLSCASA